MFSLICAGRWRLLCSILLIGGWFTVASAATSASLYTGSAAVADNTEKNRDKASAQVLTQILVKITGNTRINDNPVIAKAIKEAPLLMVSYSYRNRKGLELVAQFDAQQVNDILQSANELPSVEKLPKTLIWISLREHGSAALLGNESNSYLVRQIELTTADENIPTILPLLDLQDLNAISTASIWNYQPEIIHQASLRYPHDAVLLARITAPDDADKQSQWQGDWTLLSAGTKQDWHNEAADQKALVSAAIKKLSEEYYAQPLQHSAVNQPQKSDVALSVYGIDNLQKYAQVEQFLRQLGLVQHVAVTTLTADHVVFDLRINDSVTTLNKSLTQTHFLVALPNDNGTLIYQVIT